MTERYAYWSALCTSGAGGSLCASGTWIAGLLLVAAGILLSWATIRKHQAGE